MRKASIILICLLTLFVSLFYSCSTVIHYVTTGVQYVDAAQFGFSESNPDVEVLTSLLRENSVVLIPVGQYRLANSIVIGKDFKVEKILGVSRKNSKLIFTSSDGFILEKGVEISNLFIKGENCKGQWNFDMNVYQGGFSGIDVRKGNCHLHDLDIYAFNKGLSIEHGHVISGTFERLTLAYNGNAGLYLRHNSEGQKNNLVFRSIYAVKNGYDADNLESVSTVLNSGHGFFISGGYGNLFESCVAEYNSGCGLYIAESTAQSVLRGLTFLSTYFERNKYANAYIEAAESKSLMDNLFVIGSFYTEAGYEPVSNACSNREMVLAHAENINSSWGNSPNINIEGRQSLFEPKHNELFFADLSLAHKMTRTKKLMIVKDDAGDAAIMLNSFNPNVLENNWYKSIAEPGSYKVVVTAKNNSTRPYQLVVQLKIGTQTKVFSAFINTSEYKEYYLGGFDCNVVSRVVMTGAYTRPKVLVDDEIFISNFNIVRQNERL